MFLKRKNWLISNESLSETWKELEQLSLPCSNWLEQSSEWYDFERNTLLNKPLSLVFLRNERPIGAIRYWQHHTAIGNYLTSLGGPIWVPGEEKEVGEQLAQSIKEFRNNYLFVLILTTPFFQVDLANYGMKHLLPHGYSFLINLRQDSTMLWNNIEKRSKGGVKKATKNGLSVRVARTFDDWEEFYHLQLVHSQRKGFQNLAYDMKTLKGLYELSLGSKCVLLLCSNESKLFAGALWFLSRRLMVLHRNAWNDEQKLNANNLLFWESIIWGKDNCYQSADLGGSPVPGPGIDRGIYDFKRSWGGNRVYHDRYYRGRLYGLAFKLAKQAPGVGLIIRNIGRRVS
jgi:hypothetical protein